MSSGRVRIDDRLDKGIGISESSGDRWVWGSSDNGGDGNGNDDIWRFED